MSIDRSPSPFTREEYLGRLAKVKAKMAAQGLDALLIVGGANIVYLTGYSGESGYVPQLLLIEPKEEEPNIWVRRQDAPGVLHTAFMRPDRINGYPESYIGNPEANGYDVALDRLIELGLSTKRLGLELDSLSWPNANKFKNRLPQAQLVDASGWVTWIRLIKSPKEIELVRQASEIADRAIQRATEVIRPGVRECDAAAEIVAALCRGTERFGGHSVVSPALPSGTKTGTSHLTWTDEPYRMGTSVNIELGAYRYRYAGAIMRTVSLGKPPDRLRRIHDASVEGMAAALAAAQPGATCGDVAVAFCEVTKRHGFIKDSRCGYPIGIDWLEPTASLKIGDATVLRPNMTFHLMLGMWMEEEFGYVSSETFLVTKTGSESFAKTPRELFVVA